MDFITKIEIKNLIKYLSKVFACTQPILQTFRSRISLACGRNSIEYYLLFLFLSASTPTFTF